MSIKVYTPGWFALFNVYALNAIVAAFFPIHFPGFLNHGRGGGCVAHGRIRESLVREVIIVLTLLSLLPSPAFAAVNIPITVNVSEAVNVTGTPQIAVDVGGATRYATYTSGTGTSALTFTLTPQAGDVDLDGVTVSSPIGLNGGTIKDTKGNPLSSLAFTPPNTANIKVNYPSLGMDFVYDADGRYTLNGTPYNDLPSFLTAAGGSFTRTSIGTYYDSTGTLQTAASGAPRFDYDPVSHAAKGILIEEQRTNYLLYSHTFSAANWSLSGTSKTLVSDTAPDGSTNTVYEIAVPASGTSKSISQGLTTNQTGYVASIYLKAGTSTGANVGLYNGTTLSWGNPSSGATGKILSGPGTIVVHPNAVGGSLFKVTGLSTTDWTRVQIVVPSFSTNRLYIYPNDSGSQTIGDSVKIWGVQVELGSFATSYIPTTTTTVTRAADILTVNTGLWYGSGAGTLSSQGIQMSGASTNGSTAEIWQDTNNKISCRTGTNYYMLGGVNQAVFTLNLTQNSLQKQAISYNTNDFAATKNGSLVGTDSSGNLIASPSFMRVGNTDGNASYYYNGWVQKVKYYPARVSNTQLQLMTQ